jgi:hypothetical protein
MQQPTTTLANLLLITLDASAIIFAEVSKLEYLKTLEN